MVASRTSHPCRRACDAYRDAIGHLVYGSARRLYERLTYPVLLQHGELGWHTADNDDVSCATFARARCLIPERIDMRLAADLREYEQQFDPAIRAPNTVNFTANAFLYYETSITHYNVSESVDAYPQRQQRGDVPTRIPCSRAQLTPWLMQEFVLDSYCRVEEDRMRMFRNNQARVLRRGRTAHAGDENRTVLASSHLGSKRWARAIQTGDIRAHVIAASRARRFMTNKTADALAVVTARGKPMFFITITMNTYWHEVKASIPHGASPFDYPELTARIFKRKLDAFRTRLITGAIWGPPSANDDGTWAYCVEAPDGTGFVIDVIEFQNRCDGTRVESCGLPCVSFPNLRAAARAHRGMPHAHIVVRFAHAPPGCKDEYEPNEAAPWLDRSVISACARQTRVPDVVHIDHHHHPRAPTFALVFRRFTCGRKPTYDVMLDFEMIYRIDPADTSDPPRDARYDSADYFDCHYRVHPQLARHLMLTSDQFYGAEITPSQLLDHLRMLVLGRTTPDMPRYSQSGPLEHGPHPNGRCPDPKSRVANTPKCKVGKDGITCKSRFPCEAAPVTIIGEDGYARLRRHEGDEYIVPYNPWFLVYFGAHINVEFAASSHCITYLYKYLFKGSRGERVRFQFNNNNPEEPAHVDETKEYWEGKITSASEAWWRSMSCVRQRAAKIAHPVFILRFGFSRRFPMYQ